jgi:hypothetical protein
MMPRNWATTERGLSWGHVDLAHEINNHLTVLDLTVSTLQARLDACGEADRELRQLLGVARESIDQVRELTRAQRHF